MSIAPRFFTAIGTVPHAERLAFLTQDVRAAGTVLGFYGAAAAIGAKPAEVALMVVRRYRPDDKHRQIVLVFQQDPAFATALAKLYAARGKPLGFEAQNRWCAIPEPGFLAEETYAVLAARFPTLLLIEESPEGPRIAVHASTGFKQHPRLKLSPLPPIPKPAAAPQPEASKPAAKPTAKVLPLRPKLAAASKKPALPKATPQKAAALPLASKRRLRSAVALNERVERQVVDEFRRLLQVVSLYG